MSAKNTKKVKRKLAAGHTVTEETHPINYLRITKPENWKEDVQLKRGVIGK